MPMHPRGRSCRTDKQPVPRDRLLVNLSLHVPDVTISASHSGIDPATLFLAPSLRLVWGTFWATAMV